MLVHRLRLFLDSLVSPFLASFIPRRRGTENVMIVQEVVHSFKSKKDWIGNILIKLDLEKAYDRIE